MAVEQGAGEMILKHLRWKLSALVRCGSILVENYLRSFADEQVAKRCLDSL